MKNKYIHIFIGTGRGGLLSLAGFRYFINNTLFFSNDFEKKKNNNSKIFSTQMTKNN